MPIGVMVFDTDMYDALTPEVHGVITHFIARSTGEVVCVVDEKFYTYTMDHPDFMPTLPEHTHYILHLARKYDPSTNSDRPCITKLSYYDEVNCKVGLVREYACNV